MSIKTKMADWFIRNLGLTSPELYRHYGLDSYSGKTVTAQSALTISAVWACIRLLSETIATLPLGVYQRDASGRGLPARTHSLYGLLHDSPNADMSSAEFWESMVATYVLRGNAYALKEFAGSRLAALTPLRADLVVPDRRKSGEVYFKYHHPDGYREFSEEQIFHLKGFTLDGLTGLSPIAYARHSMGNVLAVEEAVGVTFKNGLRPAGALTVQQLLRKDQRAEIRASIAEQVAGVANTGKLMVLEAGMTYQPLAIPPEDAQMLQTRGFQVEEVCRWYRVPPFMVGHTEKVTSWGSGLEQQMIGFLTFALRPHLTRIEQTIKRSLIAPADRQRIYAEFNVEGLLRADSAARASFYSTMANNGLMSRNEIRAKENLPAMAGGDVLTVQSAMVPLTAIGQPQPATQPRQIPQDATT